jgi:hypothetical protein
MGDVDLTLRHLARQHPADLVGVFVAGAVASEAPRWLDSQLAARERRVDKALLVHRSDDRVALHAEWCWEPDGDFGFRAQEYQYQILAALRDEDAARVKAALPQRAPPQLPARVLTVAVLLNGPDGDRSTVGNYAVTPDDAEARGVVSWMIERVYQRPAEELIARPGVLWPVFVPFAADASKAGVTRAVQVVRERAHSPREFADAAAALSVFARSSLRSQGLREVVMALVEPEVIKSSSIFLQGMEEGIQKGIQKGIQRGEAKGLRAAIAQMLAARGLRLTAARRTQLEGETRVDVLLRWHTLAITASRVADIFVER